MGNFRIAYDAIEAYVQARHPEDRNGRWASKVPGTDWGMSEGVWFAAAADIINRFNALLPGKPITVPPAAKRNLRSLQLVDCQRYLAAKADAVAKTPLIKRIES